MGRELSRKSQSVSAAAAAAAAAEESTVVETLCGAERIGFPETSAKALVTRPDSII